MFMSYFSSVMMWLIPIIIGFIIIRSVIGMYKICPNDKVMVVYGAGGKEAQSAARIVHGGGVFIIPYIQDYAFLSLSPMSIAVELIGALSKTNIRVNVPSQFTISVASKNPEHMQNAARFLLNLEVDEIHERAQEIIIGSLRAVVSGLNVEELTRNRDLFIKSINDQVNTELNKIGLDLINVNIRDIKDDSGYIEAIGKKSVSEAVNRSYIDVAEQDRLGKIGIESNNRERDVTVAEQQAQSKIGMSIAARDEGIQVARYNSEKVSGENSAKAEIADSNANLAVREAKALQTSEVERASADVKIADAQRVAKSAELARDTLPEAEVNKLRIEVEASAQALQAITIAEGEAKAVLLKCEAEAQGLKLVLEAKAEGYKKLIEAAGGNGSLASTLLMIEKMAEIVEIQTEALKNIKIDKLTVWDSGSGSDRDGIKGLMRNFSSSLPQLHDIAAQVGIKLPEFMGQIADMDEQGQNPVMTTEATEATEVAEVSKA